MSRAKMKEANEAIAKVCHQANKAYCEALGDDSQAEWENAPDWARKSAIDGVAFHLQHPDATASASHNAWLAEKEATGWKYGPRKDAEKKEHPCFVAFEQLPLEQQAKDFIFRSIVHAFMDAGLA
jgi:hypothetical protein